MGKLLFDANGRLMANSSMRDLKVGDFTLDGRKDKKTNYKKFERAGTNELLEPLKTSSSLEFLKEDGDVGDIISKDYWSLYSGEEKLEPLKFTNNKTQEDVVREVVELSKNHKVIFIHG
ncbi:MAG: hypothetical protein AABX91_02020, partial [Nanoarchaeota archaeon]